MSPPPWRSDVEGVADITEEVIRIVGFDKIPEISVRSKVATPESAETPLLTKMRLARTALAARGMDECITWSFMNDEASRHFGLNDNEKRKSLTVVNAISSEIDVMRPSILPNLILAAGRSADQSNPDVAFCEVGPVFESVKLEGQQMVAAGIRAGAFGSRSWAEADATRVVDLYDAKADMLAALEACGAPKGQLVSDAPDYFHPGRSGSVRLGKNVLASFGEIHPGVLDEMDIDQAVCGFEIYLQNIPQAKKKGTEKALLKMEPLQPLSRDFAFLVEESVAAEDIRKSAMAADKKLIVDAQVFDVYQGKGVDEGMKSVALSVTLQPKGESLTDGEIEAIAGAIVEMVGKKTGAALRS